MNSEIEKSIISAPDNARNAEVRKMPEQITLNIGIGPLPEGTTGTLSENMTVYTFSVKGMDLTLPTHALISSETTHQFIFWTEELNDTQQEAA